MNTSLRTLFSILLVASVAVAQQPDEQQEPSPPPPSSGGADPSDDAFRMGSPPNLQEGLTEEDMWPAATTEGWKKPCLVRWQRSFDDAMQVARAENRPVMVAVNMDGEIASEHFAGVRYREPETAAILNRYSCVLASVYRHTPRDYDEAGGRVECPRFGTVTCGEHIQAERELYEKYFDGRRISPRHIVLDLEGQETFDVYYAWDTATVYTAFRKGIEEWPEPRELAEPTLSDLVQSANVQHRQTLERMYVTGDRSAKAELLTALMDDSAVDQVEVLRAAIFGLDLELAGLARQALAKCETEPALDLMAEALKVPLDSAERELLLGAVARLGESSSRARTLGALHSGLSSGSEYIDDAETAAIKREYAANSSRDLDVHGRAEAAELQPGDPEALLEFAEALLARAHESLGRSYSRLMFEDALAAAREAERLGASGPRLDGVVAIAISELGDMATARRRAVAAVEGGLLRLGETAEPADDAVPLSGASRLRLLKLFAEARQREIRSAYRQGGSWPPEWLSDVNAAYSAIANEPTADAQLLVDHHDFLRWLGASPRADDVLEDALERFPESAVLHDRLRARLLWEGGPEKLEQNYAERLALEQAQGRSSRLTWYAGYASLVAAEHYRRRGRFDEALGAYGRGIGFYERAAELFPSVADNCAHYVALAYAGRARVVLGQGDLAGATSALVSAFEARPDSAATPDGLNITPIQTAKMLKARWIDAGEQEQAERIQAAMDTLDPALLEPPPSERPNLGRRARRGRAGQGGSGG